jgi:hypothetical protein
MGELQTLIQAAHQGVSQMQRMHNQLVLDPRQHMKRCEESLKGANNYVRESNCWGRLMTCLHLVVLSCIAGSFLFLLTGARLLSRYLLL